MKNKLGQFLRFLQDLFWYNVAMALLAFGSAGMLIYEFYVTNADPVLIKIFQDLDLAIAYIFLTDFIIGLFLAPKKFYHIRHNFLDLLGSIPLSDGVFRVMRILRFVRLVRILRAANAGLNIQSSIKNLGHSLNNTDKKV